MFIPDPTFGNFNPACYLKGTRIATADGERPVERLALGERVLTKSGILRPAKWIGHRLYAWRFVAGNHLMLPVTIRAGALAEGVPHTDLTVSPGHAMWVDMQLVPAWLLVNGRSITQAEEVDEVAYFHVKLDHHDLLLANGAPAESFLDGAGFRGQFQNAAEFYALYPNEMPAAPMQPRLEDGFALQHIQARLAAHAGITLAAEPAGALRGYLGETGPRRVCGWAQDVDRPEAPVVLEISVGHRPVLTVLANAFRADLRKAGIGAGCHAFDVTLPADAAGAVTVRRASDGTLLPQTDEAQRRAA